MPQIGEEDRDSVSGSSLRSPQRAKHSSRVVTSACIKISPETF